MKNENKYLFKILKKELRSVAPNTEIAATYRQFSAMVCVNFFMQKIINSNVNPCPFCGGKVLGAFRTKKEAIEAWNTRAKVKKSDVSTQSTDVCDVSKNSKNSTESGKK